MSYSGPEGDGSFRLTLRLASAARYQIHAADPVGRALWGLDVDAGRGLWLDHRNRLTCVFQGDFDVAGIPLGPFPLLSLPALLLGRVPAEPAPQTEPERRDGEIEFQDEAGRRWTVELGGDGGVKGWTLRKDGEPAVWLHRRDGWWILSDRARGSQVRWREALQENLTRDLEPAVAPPGYREGECRDLYAPRPEP